MNHDVVDQQLLLILAVVLMDIQNNVAHQLALMLVFEVQQQPVYNLFVLTVNLIKKNNKFSEMLLKQRKKNIILYSILMQVQQNL